MRRGIPFLAAATLATAARLAAQATPTPPQRAAGGYEVDAAYNKGNQTDDYYEQRLVGGFRFRAPGLHLDVRGANAVLLSDREAVHALLEPEARGGLPRRGIDPPPPRRRLSDQELRLRVDRTLRAVGQVDGLSQRIPDQQLDLLRYLYFEGGVTVVRDDLEVLRCDRMWISPLDDRIVVENAEIRYSTPARKDKPRQLLIVRGPRLVKQGGRWTGRDLSITTCTASEPHYALAVGEAEIIERDGEFEVITRGQSLQIGGTSVLPLPDAHVFTGSQCEFPIKHVSAGYSQTEGLDGHIVFGLPYNGVGGRVHEWLTGRPADEFRGEWELGLGWIEKRGEPLEGGLTYRADGLYEGRTRAFVLDDRGTDLREIQTNLDGSPIERGTRSLVSSANRVTLGPSTHVDLVAFQASDPAVYSEFFAGDYRSEQVPETSVYLHHADDNRLLTANGRWNLDSFSYRDDRALSDRFVEEIPVVTYQWLAQPIGETPWGTPIVVDLETELAQRRSDYDPRAAVRVADRTFRADQLVELSMPFHLGPVNVRPYASGRGIWYDNTVAGGSDGRVGLEGGVQLGTRLSRTWTWLDADGEQSLRHVIAPKITYRNRFFVDKDPGEFFQFDTTDALTERELVRVEVRNLLQRSGTKDKEKAATSDFVMLDLAQDLWPNAGRDNGGETWGLLYYDLRIRPTVSWLPVDTFAFAVFGDYDYHHGLRTLDTELQIGPIAGITWTADYREDQVVRGAVGLTANTRLLDRWNLYAGSQRDLQTDQWLSYSFGLVRDDHDWSISLNASYNPYSQQTTFRLEFLPHFGGMNRGRQDWFGGEAVRASNFATSY